LEKTQKGSLDITKWLEWFLNTTKWANIGKCSQDTALRDIQDLIEKEILIKSEKGGRSTNYVLKSNER